MTAGRAMTEIGGQSAIRLPMAMSAQNTARTDATRRDTTRRSSNVSRAAAMRMTAALSGRFGRPTGGSNGNVATKPSARSRSAAGNGTTASATAIPMLTGTRTAASGARRMSDAAASAAPTSTLATAMRVRASRDTVQVGNDRL